MLFDWGDNLIKTQESFELTIDDDHATMSDWVSKVIRNHPWASYKVTVQVEEVELECDEE